MNLKMSPAGLALTKQFEGCKLTAYQDQVGVLTIGYGHTGTDVKEGLTITGDQADALLRADVAHAERNVNSQVMGIGRLSQNQFDALVDFEFNTGGLSGSTLLKKLNAGDDEGAAKEFLRWDHAGGKVVKGLTKRRQAEADLFNTK